MTKIKPNILLLPAALTFASKNPMVIAAIYVLISISNNTFADDLTNNSKGICDIGPIDRTYGNAQWYVYSCTADRNVVIVSKPGNPAFPFVFVFIDQKGKYELHGEGTGDNKVTEAAFNELKALQASEITALIQETMTLARLRRP